mgnify:CR=1 FL=1
MVLDDETTDFFRIRHSLRWHALRLRAFCFAAILCFSANAARAEWAGDETERLIDAVYDLRATNGLNAIPLSPTLQRVARAHAADLERRPPSGRCNLHSWSPSGAWSPCCYTADHAQARCMWDKPREIGRGAYRGDGFEIVCWNSERMTTEIAMRCWRDSRAHQNVLLNRREWRDIEWRALGVAMSAHYAVLWVGQVAER